jgi:hypothetical protein
MVSHYGVECIFENNKEQHEVSVSDLEWPTTLDDVRNFL